MNLKRFLSLLAMVTLIGSAQLAKADSIFWTNAITVSTNWYATNTYFLQTVVYVETNVTLAIEPGTVIKAVTTNSGTVFPTPGIPGLVSCLWVARGGKLYATGTVTRPIIFTVDGDDVNNPNDLPYNFSGQWGGVVLLGNGVINSAQDGTGNVSTPKFEVYEGTTGAGTIPEQVFGGSNDTDNSGELKYVSIRYAGTVFAPAKELNGLTMAAIGSATKISYVECYKSSDDAFEWWGGVVSANHLVAAFCEDDDFDTDQGYRGTNQFLFGIKPPWQGSSDSRGLETDGDLNQAGYPANNASPASSWYGYNITEVGRGTNIAGFGGGIGWNARDEARPNVFNSVFADFAAGLQVDNDATNEFLTGVADVRNCVWQVSSNLTGGLQVDHVAFLFNQATRANTVESAKLGTISYTNLGLLDPRPKLGSPVFSNLTNGAPVAVSYRGAFSSDDTWADGWTALSSEGYLKPAPVHVDVTNAITVNTTWFASNTYFLHTVVYVQSNASLTIEPGTVVRAVTTNSGTVFPTPGIPGLVSCLWVSRGGKLYATGTVSKPIIFTVDNDDLSNPTDLPYNYSGQWGGVVLLGNAVINSAQDGTGNVSTPRYEVYEGTTGAGTIPEQVFGGNDDTDNSGELKYVSIRYAGTVFAPAKELNGLTLAAIGSGTKISYVECYNSSDDAFEWWGGTVSANHLVAAFCEDDDFDTDQGYRGTNQFLFGIKPPWQGSSDSRGLETDGDLNQAGYPNNNATPTSTWYGYNITEVGRGTNIAGFGGGIGWNARDEARPNVFNSVFAEFAAGLQVDNDDTNEFQIGLAEVRNCIWQVSSNLTGGLQVDHVAFLFNDVARSNTVQSAGLGTISYTNLSLLNPRPLSGSPALSGGTNGAPVSVGYRGAFGPNDDWADGWTALSSLRYLLPASPQVTIAKNGNNVDISWLSLVDRTYQLQSRSPITGAWGNVGSPVTGTGGTMTLTQPVSTETYYQVVLTNP